MAQKSMPALAAGPSYQKDITRRFAGRV